MTDYPYYIYPDLLALQKGGLSEVEAMRHKRRIAANVGSEDTLRRILGIDPEEFAHFYPDMVKNPLDTLKTIDSFLTQFGQGEEAGLYQDPLPPQEVQEVQAVQLSPEAKARECIKHRRYEEALEIITSLNLNNPEKSIYFADQIRFLRKLILNESRRKN